MSFMAAKVVQFQNMLQVPVVCSPVLTCYSCRLTPGLFTPVVWFIWSRTGCSVRIGNMTLNRLTGDWIDLVIDIRTHVGKNQIQMTDNGLSSTVMLLMWIFITLVSQRAHKERSAFNIICIMRLQINHK